MADTPLTRAETLQVAKAQKGVLWCVALNILLSISSRVINAPAPDDPEQVGAAIGLAMLGVQVLYFCVLIPVMLYFVYRLATALHSRAAWLWCITMIFPCVNLILLLVLSSRATKAIRAQGVKVGLMGAKLADLQQPSAEES